VKSVKLWSFEQTFFFFLDISYHVLLVSKKKCYDNVNCDQTAFWDVGQEMLLFTGNFLNNFTNSYNECWGIKQS